MESRPNLLLVNPPQHHLLEGFPGSLIPLAGYVASRAPEVRVALCDLGHETADSMTGPLRAALQAGKSPVIVGITSTTASYQMALAVARTVRRETRGSGRTTGNPRAPGTGSRKP